MERAYTAYLPCLLESNSLGRDYYTSVANNKNCSIVFKVVKIEILPKIDKDQRGRIEM